MSVGSRSPLLRKAGLRSVGLGKRWKAELDKLCRRAVFARDKVCVWCGNDGGQHHWAHIRSRRYISTRWDIWNSIRLCAGCHLRWHHQPLMGAEWFRTSFPDRAAHLANFDLGMTAGKTDRAAIKLYLEQEIRKYEEGA